MKKKILHFIDSGGVYGAEHVLLNLSREMLHSKDYTPVVGCIVQQRDEQSDLYDKALEFGIEAIRIKINNKIFFIDIFKTAFLFKKIEIDCIHSHGYKPSVVGYVIQKITGIPVISTCHLWYMAGKKALKQRLMIRLELFFYRFFPKVVCVSEPIRQFLLHARVPENKIVWIKNGIYISDYSLESVLACLKFKQELGISPETFVLVNIARLSKQKAQDNIIAAANILKQQGVDCMFLIVGEGPMRSDYEETVRNLHLQDYVKFLGFRQDVKHLLCLSNAFVLPSRDEGLPMSLLEAMASHTPAIVTPVGDIPDLVQHKKSAYIIPVNDVGAIVKAVQWMIINQDACKKIAENAFEHVNACYSASAMFKAYQSVYEEVIRE
jgi:glycosyltransferase involved in cell wall biosynthesis